MQRNQSEFTRQYSSTKIKSITELSVLQITDQVSFFADILTYQVYRTKYVHEVEVGAWNNWIIYNRDKRDKSRLSNYRVCKRSLHYDVWMLLVFDSILRSMH